MTTRELDIKFNTYRGHYFFITGKVVEELLEFKYNTKIGIKLTLLSTLRCSHL